MNSKAPLVHSELIQGLNFSILKYTGMWHAINLYRTQKKKSVYLWIQGILTVVLLIPYVIIQFMCFFALKVDFQKVTFIVVNSMACLQVITKTAIFWFGVEEQCLQFDCIFRNFLTSIPEHKRSHADKIYRKMSKLTNVLCYFATALNTTICSTWVFVPGIDSEYIATPAGTKISKDGPKKILGGWYPFDFINKPMSDYIYVYEMIQLLYAGLVATIYECVLTQMVMALYAHFQVLSYHISTLRKDDSLFNNKIDGDKIDKNSIMNKELIKILHDYEKLLRYGHKLKMNYNALITTLLGTGVLILIISIFHFLASEKDLVLALKFLLFMTYVIAEFSLYCFSGTYLETASTDIQFAMYSSEWYTSDKKCRFIAQMVMARALRPVSLIAVKMYRVNVETLMAIFQFAYTSSALMSRMFN